MATPTGINVENPVSLHTDKIVCRLDLFPELVRALHYGDLQTGRLFCAQLFDCDGRRNLLSTGAITPQAGMKALRRIYPKRF
jgi:hypothetical protein